MRNQKFSVVEKNHSFSIKEIIFRFAASTGIDNEIESNEIYFSVSAGAATRAGFFHKVVCFSIGRGGARDMDDSQLVFIEAKLAQQRRFKEPVAALERHTHAALRGKEENVINAQVISFHNSS